MPMEAVVGRQAIVASFASFMAMGGQVGVDIVHLAADGPLVMTERIDHFVNADGRTISLPVMGVCEVHDERITAWRDYFDLSEFSAALGR
jgi:limonene-1,2-epoxide hydrolase